MEQDLSAFEAKEKKDQEQWAAQKAAKKQAADQKATADKTAAAFPGDGGGGSGDNEGGTASGTAKDKLKIMKRTACQFLPRWHASSLATRPRLRALSVCSRRRASSMAKTRRPKRMGPSSTASLPPPTPSRDERARTSGAREAARHSDPWGDG